MELLILPAMSHIAIQEKLDGAAVNWMEQLTNEQYNKYIFNEGFFLL